MSATVNILFAADLFNEGLDLPEVDTVLFLRPTESATVFLQQLGRGLRRTARQGGADGPGLRRPPPQGISLRPQAARADRELRGPGSNAQVNEGFPFLPAGCSIDMDRQSQALVLENLKSQIASRWKHVVEELRRLGDTDLESFLAEARVELSDVLRQGGHSWTQLRRDAGLPMPPGSGS